jgi:uncharacterized membrane protein
MNEILKYIILNFWKITGVLAGFLLALLLVIFGLLKTLFILAVILLGFILGKWKDEGISIRQEIKKLITSMTINNQ